MMQVRLAKNKSNHSLLKETFEPHLLGEPWPPCQQQRDVLRSSSKETECALLSTPWHPPYQYGIVSARLYSFSEVRAKMKKEKM